MIDPKQLRLGNIVSLNKDQDGVVDTIHEDMITIKGDNDNFHAVINIYPKRINDDILDNINFVCVETPKVSLMGVEYINKKWVFDDWITIEKEDQDIDAELTYDVNDDLFDVFMGDKYITCIEHFHELQNLFFFIARIELPYE